MIPAAITTSCKYAQDLGDAAVRLVDAGRGTFTITISPYADTPILRLFYKTPPRCLESVSPLPWRRRLSRR